MNRLLPENSLPPARPTDFTDVTSDQVMLLTPTMTAKDVIELLGDTHHTMLENNLTYFRELSTLSFTIGPR